MAVESSEHYLKRTAVSDSALNNGRFAILGTSEYADALVQVNAPSGLFEGSPSLRSAVFCRYEDTSNWLMLKAPTGLPIVGQKTHWSLIKRVAGEETTIYTGTGGGYSGTATLSLRAAANGSITATVDGTSETFYDADFSSSGAIPKGKIGIYDAYTAAGAMTRRYDNFFAYAPSAATTYASLFSERSARLRGSDAVRQDSTGDVWGQMPDFQGARLRIPPAGPRGLSSGLSVKARRTNVDVVADEYIEDELEVSLSAVPRVVLLG